MKYNLQDYWGYPYLNTYWRVFWLSVFSINSLSTRWRTANLATQSPRISHCWMESALCLHGWVIILMWNTWLKIINISHHLGCCKSITYSSAHIPTLPHPIPQAAAKRTCQLPWIISLIHHVFENECEFVDSQSRVGGLGVAWGRWGLPTSG